MKKYINFNTEKRMNGSNDFEKDFFELVINSASGKTMENLRKKNLRLVTNEKEFLKYNSRPTCCCSIYIGTVNISIINWFVIKQQSILLISLLEVD